MSQIGQLERHLNYLAPGGGQFVALGAVQLDASALPLRHLHSGRLAPPPPPGANGSSSWDGDERD